MDHPPKNSATDSKTGLSERLSFRIAARNENVRNQEGSHALMIENNTTNLITIMLCQNT
jgi:hypothetical protein